MKSHIIKLISLLSAITLLLAACSPGAATPALQNGGQKPTEIRIAMLPLIDGLPMYAAEKQGYFSANGVKVSFIPAASAAERDQLIIAGQADAMINDLISLALYNKQGIQVQTVGLARAARPDIAMYRILAAKDSGIHNPTDLAGVPIGISQGTVIDYITTRLLEKAGLDADQIQAVAVPKMSERMALLQSGELKAATLPEPFSTMAQKDGAQVVTDDSKYPEYGISVISFRKEFIDQYPQAVKGFMKAVEQGAADINNNPEAWRYLLGEYKLLPEPAQAGYPMPVFPGASIPSEAQWKDVIDWCKSRQLITTDLNYGDSIRGDFLP